MKGTLLQLIREFWLPMAVAVAWTAYVVWDKPLNIKNILSALGPAFFLASWMTGQFFRVRKQEGVRDGLTSLEQRLQALVGQLEEQAEEAKNYTMGGDSYCYFGVGIKDGNDNSMWTVAHEGKYPLYNVQARIVDLAKFHETMKTSNPFATDTILQIGDVAPGQASIITSMSLGPQNERNFNIFFSARNGHFNQCVRLRRVGSKWRVASSIRHVGSGDETRILRVDDGYPLDAEGKPVGI